jgi:glutaminase
MPELQKQVAQPRCFGLHVLNRNEDIRSCVIADYRMAGLSSRRNRQPFEVKILHEHHKEIRVLELVGAFNFATMDYLSRRLAGDGGEAQLLILDFRRVPSASLAAGRILGETLTELASRGVTPILTGFEKSARIWELLGEWVGQVDRLRHFPLLDDAVEWAEDQIIYRYGGFERLGAAVHLAEQALLAGLSPEEINEIAQFCHERDYKTGERIVGAGEPAVSLFFLLSGLVSVKLRSGARLASLAPGMAFGEMALLDQEERSADVFADTSVRCLELPMSAYASFRKSHPASGERIMRNLCALLAARLMFANAKVDVLSAC